MSLLGAEAAPPVPADLAGLLAAGARLTRSNAGAQLAIVVDHPWRASVLVAECARRGLAATCVTTLAEHIGVRTAHSDRLSPLADAWGDGPAERVPPGFALDGQVLRLWVEAGGRHEPGGAYVLPVGRPELATAEALGAALVAVGLPAQLVTPRGGPGPSYRIVGKRRMTRLIEMVGDPPKQAPAGIWPS